MLLLKHQADLRDQLLAAMAQQLVELKAACDRELTTVEAAYTEVAGTWVVPAESMLPNEMHVRCTQNWDIVMYLHQLERACKGIIKS